MFEIHSIKYSASLSQGVHSVDVSINILARSKYPEPPVTTARKAGNATYTSAYQMVVGRKTVPTSKPTQSPSDLRAGLARWIGFYNTAKPHTALDGRSPDEAYYDIKISALPGLVPAMLNNKPAA